MTKVAERNADLFLRGDVDKVEAVLIGKATCVPTANMNICQWKFVFVQDYPCDSGSLCPKKDNWA